MRSWRAAAENEQVSTTRTKVSIAAKRFNQPLQITPLSARHPSILARKITVIESRVHRGFASGQSDNWKGDPAGPWTKARDQLTAAEES